MGLIGPPPVGYGLYEVMHTTKCRGCGKPWTYPVVAAFTFFGWAVPTKRFCSECAEVRHQS